jgi:Lsr2
MAQKVVTLYTDDLTGEESAEISTYTVLVNGVGVEVDLTPESHDKLLEALSPFLNADGARRVRGGSPAAGARGKRRSAGPADGPDTAKIRAWAKENGYEVNDRGRVPASVKEAYEKAN